MRAECGGGESGANDRAVCVNEASGRADSGSGGCGDGGCAGCENEASENEASEDEARFI